MNNRAEKRKNKMCPFVYAGSCSCWSDRGRRFRLLRRFSVRDDLRSSRSTPFSTSSDPMVVMNLDQSKYKQMVRRGIPAGHEMCQKMARDGWGPLAVPVSGLSNHEILACPHSAQPSIKQVEAPERKPPERGEALTFEMCTLAAKAVHRLNIA